MRSRSHSHRRRRRRWGVIELRHRLRGTARILSHIATIRRRARIPRRHHRLQLVLPENQQRFRLRHTERRVVWRQLAVVHDILDVGVVVGTMLARPVVGLGRRQKFYSFHMFLSSPSFFCPSNSLFLSPLFPSSSSCFFTHSHSHLHESMELII